MRRTLLLLAVLTFSIHHSERAVGQNTSAKTQLQLHTESRNQIESVDRTRVASTDRIGTAREYYQRGLALLEARELTQAGDSFRKALEYDPEFADAYAALGRTYFKMREWQKAVDNLNRAAILNARRRDARKVVPNTDVTEKQKAQSGSVARPSETNFQNNRPPIQVKTVSSSNAAATNAPLKVSNRSWSTPVDAEIVSSSEITASTINLRNLLPQIPVKETSTASVSASARIEETALTKIYRVGVNDVLDVRLNAGAGEQSTLYTVTAAGLLEHPLLNEPMPVAGLTVEEIASRIEADLRKRAIVENAKALVGVRDYASHSVLVSGLVKESGTKFLRREAIPLYVVVADAQPFPEAASITLVRSGNSNRIYEMDLNQVADMNFLVRSGDVITLHPNPTQFVYIAGEIKSPGEKTFRRGLTLMQLVLVSGGLGQKAKVAEIARDNEAGFLVTTRFKVEEILAGKAVDPVLKPGDRVSILR